MEIVLVDGSEGQNHAATLLRLEHGLDTPVTAGLVEDGLASACQETVRAAASTLEVVRLQITEQSRRALGGRAEHRIPRSCDDATSGFALSVEIPSQRARNATIQARHGLCCRRGTFAAEIWDASSRLESVCARLHSRRL
jgi:hypothetical protein